MVEKIINKKNIFRTLGVLVTIAILATSAVVWSSAPKKSLKPSEYHIGTTYDKAMQDNKPFIALFYADWCTYCMRFMPKYKIINDVYKGKYNFAMINGDTPEAAGLMRDYAVGGFPTIYIIDPVLDNRIAIPNTIYDDLGRLRSEFDRYLRVREKFSECKAD